MIGEDVLLSEFWKRVKERNVRRVDKVIGTQQSMFYEGISIPYEMQTWIVFERKKVTKVGEKKQNIATMCKNTNN